MTKQEMNKKYPKRAGYYYGNFNNQEYKYPSITGILGCLSKDFLIAWAAKKCAEIALDDPTLTVDEVYRLHRQRDVIAAGDRGKGVHNIAPKIITRQPFDLEAKYIGYIDGVRKYQQEHSPIQIFTEKTVISHTFGIGGTCDGGLEVNGERWLIDYKTSSSVYKAHKVQLQFYKHGLKEMGEDYDKAKIIHLPGDGTYSLVDVDEDLTILPYLKKVWEWQKGA